jgi:phosphatidylserine decarboxylase
VFAREGYPLIAAAAGFALLCAAVGFGVWGGLWLTGLGLVVLGFVVWFFRDPPRTPPEPAVDLLLAPADGKVIEIVEEPEPLYLDGPARRISIFLSPLNVHVNRSPATGVVEYQRYVPGEYLVAWHPKASEKNERSEVGLRHPSGTRVLFKQIAGAVARRIVFDAPIGKPLAAGERYGIVKFGSRMDIAVPPHVQITATIGQRVTAGETVLGSFSAPPPAAARPPR